MKLKQIFKSIRSQQSGYALITLLFFMGMGIVIITAATIVLATNIKASSTSEQGLAAYYAAESGAEDGLVRVLRNPTFVGTIPAYSIGDAQTSIVITSGRIVSTGQFGNTVRKVEVQTTYTNGVLTVSSWREIQ